MAVEELNGVQSPNLPLEFINGDDKDKNGGDGDKKKSSGKVGIFSPGKAVEIKDTTAGIPDAPFTLDRAPSAASLYKFGEFTDFDPTGADQYIRSGFNQQDFRASRQPTYKKWGNALRAIPNAAMGILENVGYLGTAAGEGVDWIFGGDFDSADIYDNPFSGTLSDWSKSLNEYLPIYKPENWDNQTLLQQLGSANFAGEVSGVVESGLEFLTPGAGLAKIGAGAKIIGAGSKFMKPLNKFARGTFLSNTGKLVSSDMAKWTNLADRGVQTGFLATQASLLNANDAAVQVRDELLRQRAEGLNGMSDEEIEDRVNDVYKKTFGTNLAIHVPSAIFEAGLLGKITGKSIPKVKGVTLTNTGAVAGKTPSIFQNIVNQGLKTAAVEGLYEENAEDVIRNMSVRYGVEGKMPSYFDILAELPGGMIENIADNQGIKTIFLGGLGGFGFGALAGARGAGVENKLRDKTVSLINESTSNFMDLSSLYEKETITDENGNVTEEKIKLDAEGDPVINKDAMLNYIKNANEMSEINSAIHYYEDVAKDPVKASVFKGERFAKWTLAHYEAGLGNDLLLKLDNMKTYTDDDLIKLGIDPVVYDNNGDRVSIPEIVDGYKKDAKELNNIYNSISRNIPKTDNASIGRTNEAFKYGARIYNVNKIIDGLNVERENLIKETWRNADLSVKEIDGLISEFNAITNNIDRVKADDNVDENYVDQLYAKANSIRSRVLKLKSDNAEYFNENGIIAPSGMEYISNLSPEQLSRLNDADKALGELNNSIQFLNSEYNKLTNKETGQAYYDEKVEAQYEQSSEALRNAADQTSVVISDDFGNYEIPKLEKNFVNEVKKTADELGVPVSHLMAVMGFESAGTYSSDVENIAGSGAVGLIQFMPRTAAEFVLDADTFKKRIAANEALPEPLSDADLFSEEVQKFKEMTPVQQMEFVKKHIGRKKGEIKNLEDLYMSVLYPEAVGKGPDYELPNWAYAGNEGLDTDQNGKITVAEATNRVREFLPTRESLENVGVTEFKEAIPYENIQSRVVPVEQMQVVREEEVKSEAPKSGEQVIKKQNEDGTSEIFAVGETALIIPKADEGVDTEVAPSVTAQVLMQTPESKISVKYEDGSTDSISPERVQKISPDETVTQVTDTVSDVPIIKPEEGMTEVDYFNEIAESSQNPSEIFESWRSVRNLNELRQSSFDNTLNDYLEARVSRASFVRYADENVINRTIARNYFRKNGLSLDVLADHISEETNRPVSEDELVQFMINNPGGLRKNELEKKLEDRFREVTGKRITSYTPQEQEVEELQQQIVPARYDVGKKVRRTDFPELNNFYEAVASESQNPLQVAAGYKNRFNQLVDSSINVKDAVISRNLRPLPDRNFSYLPSTSPYRGINPLPVDVQADFISDLSGVNITTNDIVDYLDRFPDGITDTALDDDVLNNLSDRFKELTGEDLDYNYADDLVPERIEKVAEQTTEEIPLTQETIPFQLEAIRDIEVSREIESVVDTIKQAFPLIEVITDINEYNAEVERRGITTDPLGFVSPDGRVYINELKADVSTPVHEFAHIYTRLLKENNPEAYQEGIELALNSPYAETVAAKYQDLEGENLGEEILATAVGDQGALIIEEESKGRFQKFLDKFWKAIKKFFGIRSANPEVNNKTFEEFANSIAAKLLAGKPISEVNTTDVSALFNEVYESRDYEEGAVLARETPSKKREYINSFKEFMSSLWKDVKDIAEPIDTAINKISKNAFRRLKRYDFEAEEFINSNQNKIVGTKKDPKFLNFYRNMDKADQNELKYHLLNSNWEKGTALLKKYKADKTAPVVKNLLDKIYEDSVLSGVELEYLLGHFPRRVKDVDGLLKYLEKNENLAPILKALKEAQFKAEREKGKPLNKDEQADIVNKLLRGYKVSGITLSPTGNMKDRAIMYVDPEMLDFYADVDEALLDYIFTMGHAIKSREMFGKGQDINDSVGAVVLDELLNGNITPEQSNELSDLLRARFSDERMSKGMQNFRSLSYMAYLGSPASAITQIGDLGFSIEKNGFFLTLKSLSKAAVRKSELKKSDINASQIADDLRNPSKLGKAVNEVFKYTGLSGMDSVGKETFINATLTQYRKLASSKSETDQSKLRSKLSDFFFQNEKRSVRKDNKITRIEEGDEAGKIIKVEPGEIIEEYNVVEKVISDLKEGVVSDDIRYLLFSELSGIQPITKSAMPKKYLTMGNGKIFYMLKSFTIRQLDFIRRQAFDKIADGIRNKDKKLIAEGVKSFVTIAAVFTSLGMGADELKRLLFLKSKRSNLTLSDRVVENLIKITGFSKYSLYTVQSEGIASALADEIAPPINFFDEMWKLANPWDEKSASEKERLRYLYFVPGVGRPLYNWWTQ